MASSLRSRFSSAARWHDTDRLLAIVLGITLVALVLRFVVLGDRIAHWDEARVGYWAFDYLRTDDFRYRYILHGPFIQIVNRHVFALVGATDGTSRAVVALVGGLLPMTALLFREHLRKTEVVLLALLLATNPILLYYSRFFRSSVLVAAFMVTAFGLFVRASDTHRLRYVHAGVVFVALGFTAKENAVLYLLVWLGAVVLLIDHTLYRPFGPTTGIDRVRATWEQFNVDRPWGVTVLRWAGHSLLALWLFGLVIVLFYAPRSGDPAGIGLWQAMGQPGKFPSLFEHMASDIRQGFEYWFGGASDPGCFQSNLIDSYVCFLKRTFRVLAGFGAVVVGFGLVGFLYERYWSARPRNLVMFASYWGLASLLGYPLGMDIFGPWVLVNIVVPLAIPAAVGLGVIVRFGREAFDADDRVSAGLAGVVLLLVVGQVVSAGVTGVYLEPQSPENDLVQYAQPAGDFRAELRHLEPRSPDRSEPLVIVYGEWLVDGQSEAVRKPPCIDWFNALPLPWYFATNDVNVVCATDPSELDDHLERQPVMVITRANDTEELSPRLEGYTVTTYDFRADLDPPPPQIAFYIAATDDTAAERP